MPNISSKKTKKNSYKLSSSSINININMKLNSGVTPDGIKWKKTGSTTDNEISYSMKRIGGFKSIITGGEGVVMKFTGPCEIYTQSKDIYGLLQTLSGLVQNNKSSSHGTLDFLGKVLS